MGEFTSRKNFDFNKFVKIFGRPPKNKYGVVRTDINYAIQEACGGEKNFDTADELMRGMRSDSILLLTSEYMEDTKTQLRRLDSSFKYTPVMQYLEVGFAEYGYLSSNKTQYSFLTYTYEYNSNYDFDAVKVYTKISKSKLKNISNDIIRAHDFNNSNCHRLIFNINFNWNISRLKKLFTKSVKLRQRSLRTYFKEGDENGPFKPKELKDAKRTHFYFLKESKISRYYDFKKINIGKNESYDYLDFIK